MGAKWASEDGERGAVITEPSVNAAERVDTISISFLHAKQLSRDNND